MGKKRILVVDWDVKMEEELKRSVELHGRILTSSAANIADAKIYLKHGEYDIVIIEGTLSSSEHFVSEVRRKHPDCKFIAISEDPRQRDSLVRAGCDCECDRKHVVNKVTKLVRT